MITNVQWDNDPILGNLSLSFIKDEGAPTKPLFLQEKTERVKLEFSKQFRPS